MTRNSLQKECIERIKTKSLEISPPEDEIVKQFLIKLLKCDDEIVRLALGNLGEKLKDLVKLCDLSHPALPLSLQSILGQGFEKEFDDCISLASLVINNKLDSLQKFFSGITKSIGKNLAKDAIRKLDVHCNNRLHVRFLISQQERENIPKNKKGQ